MELKPTSAKVRSGTVELGDWLIGIEETADAWEDLFKMYTLCWARQQVHILIPRHA